MKSRNFTSSPVSSPEQTTDSFAKKLILGDIYINNLDETSQECSAFNEKLRGYNIQRLDIPPTRIT